MPRLVHLAGWGNGPDADTLTEPLMIPGERDLTVAVIGPTGTFGFGLIPQLQADGRVARINGIARRPFDPAAHGMNKAYRRGDVRTALPCRMRRRADVVVPWPSWSAAPRRMRRSGRSTSTAH